MEGIDANMEKSVLLAKKSFIKVKRCGYLAVNMLNTSNALLMLFQNYLEIRDRKLWKAKKMTNLLRFSAQPANRIS